jgi:uncharacterized protein
MTPSTSTHVVHGQPSDYTERPTVARVAVALEVTAVATVVVFDLLQPTLVLLALAALSLLLRRESPRTLGLVRPEASARLVASMAAFAVAWTALHLVLFIPVAERLTGTRQDMSGFAAIEGDLGSLLVMLALSWTIAAIGEEIVYRGYLLTRVTELPTGRWHLWLAVLIPAILFGLAHTEQGAVGVILTAIDGAAFALIRLRTGTLWASVLAHGFINTAGFVAFYFLGPVYGLW